MDKITEVLKNLNSAFKYLTDLTAQARAQVVKAKEIEDRSNARLKDVEQREKAVVVKERLIRSAEVLQDQKNRLDTKESELANREKASAKKLKDEFAKVEQKASDLKNIEDNLKVQLEKLETDKATYEKRILAKLSR